MVYHKSYWLGKKIVGHTVTFYNTGSIYIVSLTVVSNVPVAHGALVVHLGI